MGNKEVMRMNLTAVVLQTDDIKHLAQWYITQLDLDKVSEADDAIILAGDNGFAVEIREGKPLDNPERVRLMFHAENLDVIFNRMHEEPEAEMLTGPQETNFGRRVVTTHDRAGHTVEIFSVEDAHGAEDLTLDKVSTEGVSGA